jgi:hypothetical protein
MRHVVALTLACALAFAGSPASAQTPIPQILPGVSVGPVNLGMTEPEGRAAAEAFERATGCQIDIDVAAGHVEAAGSRYGGCLEITIPEGPVLSVQMGPQRVPLVAGIGGSPIPLGQAFGTPEVFRLAPEIAALLWKNGLVAQIAVGDQVSVVTYLAIVPPGTTAPPYSLLYHGPAPTTSRVR